MSGWFVFLSGKVEPKRWAENELEFKINSIMLLSESGAKWSGNPVNINLG